MGDLEFLVLILTMEIGRCTEEAAASKVIARAAHSALPQPRPN